MNPNAQFRYIKVDQASFLFIMKEAKVQGPKNISKNISKVEENLVKSRTENQWKTESFNAHWDAIRLHLWENYSGRCRSWTYLHWARKRKLFIQRYAAGMNMVNWWCHMVCIHPLQLGWGVKENQSYMDDWWYIWAWRDTLSCQASPSNNVWTHKYCCIYMP